MKIKENVRLAETLKTKNVIEENKNVIGEEEERASVALFPCGQEITEGEECKFEADTQQELLVHYKHFHEVQCAKCKMVFSSSTELKKT